MEQQDLTYIEKLQNLHVLMETRQMLQNKLTELKGNSPSFELVEEDLRKIDQEIEALTEKQSLEGMDQSMTHSLFNPAVIEELEEQ
ncbi:hypothetical protein BTR23_22900 [Alkalihalophilus pseudofirmus]|uniref:hypothetical protein n=1 Tax=Alkalihalobacterium alkalinitrilicum TaxID=427920 RepID=UPI00094D7202|nr:hypothetical protein [Alkalihalobacterium alkalinitrilicum]OLO26543.1 hypothetical protein BTR23_22900 [Alkalihalophilus pseudofirmus]